MGYTGIKNIDGRDVLPATSGAGFKAPPPKATKPVATWDHGTATTTVTKASAAHWVANAQKLAKKTPAPKPAAKKVVKPVVKPVAKPAAIAAKPVTTSSNPTKPTSTPTVATPAAVTGSGGLSLGMIALVAGGLFLVVVLMSRRKRR